MEQVKLTDDVLKRAFQDLSEELIEEWEKGEEIQHEFSKRFEDKMNKLIKSNNHREKKTRIIGFAKRLSFAVASIIIVCMFFYNYSITARANPMLLFEKMELILEDSTLYIYDEDIETYRFYPYEPTYIPEGYEEVKRIIGDHTVKIEYTNEQKERITWIQIYARKNELIGMDEEYDEMIELEYAGEHIRIHTYEDGYKSLYYESGACIFMMNCTDISVEDMYEMVKDMKPVEK